MGSLDQKVAIVTGGSSGNGRAIAIEFARQGARAVIIADVRREPREGGDTTERLVERSGAQARFVETDVRHPDNVQAAIAASADYGGVTVMVNNAGVLATTPFLEVDEEELSQSIDVNVKGCFYGSQFAARSMIGQGQSGSIINMSSTAALRGSGELSTYSMTKGAVQTLTFALARDLGSRGIRVNTLNPGVIRTEMTTRDKDLTDDVYLTPIPLGRFGIPRDVADVAVFLASEKSSYINGSSIVVDGGATYSDF